MINEYLDEVTPGRMLPEAPLPRARARSFIEFSNALLRDVIGLTGAKDEEALAPVVDRLGTKLDRLEGEIGEGPFFLGEAMSLVDAAFLPALQRLAWANDLYPELASYRGRPKVAGWWAALATKESVAKSAVPDLRQRFETMIARDRGGYQSLIGARVTSA
ncbi:MAG: glutathione S-transferase family protein [Myxococcota bacterium]